jgi:hypothetical protein
MRTLLAAWRDDKRWDELRLIPSVICEETGWRNDPVVPRQGLLAILAELPRPAANAGGSSEWLSLQAFEGALREHAPDYLRPDGDFESWLIRDADTGEYLRGIESWERVEGALARHLITRSLRWLGLVELGLEGDKPIACAFRLSELGWRMLHSGGSILSEQENEPSRRVATVTEDGLVAMPLEETLYDRYQLERFAEWQSQSGEARYQITDETIWQSQNAGIKVDQIIAFLRRVTDDAIPPAVMRQLFACRARFGRAVVLRTALLQTADEETMALIMANPQVRDLLGESLSPTVCLVHERSVDELVERLKELGVWPRLRLH